jgi:hypothetical protein
VDKKQNTDETPDTGQLALNGAKVSAGTASGTGPAGGATPVLKYHAQTSAIPGCPDGAMAPFNGPAFHAVHQPVGPEDFMPKALRRPQELSGKSDQERCKMWGVSMFQSEEQLLACIRHVEHRVRLFRKLMGNHCARFDLSGADGRRTAADHFGHFTFYEYQHFDAVARMAPATLLPP